jgi:hypothetical protein
MVTVERRKSVMGYPLFATLVWLVSQAFSNNQARCFFTIRSKTYTKSRLLFGK